MYSGDGAMFGGGGFMPSQSATDQHASAAAGPRRSGNAETGLQPLTVKMISQASQKPGDDTFIIDGVEVNNVTLVGMVHDKDDRTIDTSFMLDDSTGRIEVKRWIDGQESEEFSEMRSVKDFTYVRVHGHLRTFQNKLNVVAFSVRPITDFNEITFHFLEVIYVHLHNQQKNGITRTGNKSTPVTKSTIGPTASTATTSNYNQYMPLAAAAAAPAAANGGGVDECQKRVYAIFEEPSSMQVEQGLHVDEVAQRMVGYTHKQVRDAIDFLVNEGFIYSTIDDDHFKSTNA